jgi:hypothetical protein
MREFNVAFFSEYRNIIDKWVKYISKKKQPFPMYDRCVHGKGKFVMIELEFVHEICVHESSFS